MASFASITADKLARLIGTPKCPAIVDVRELDDISANPYLLPGSSIRDASSVEGWAREFRDHSIVVLCRHGGKLSEGVAAWLRTEAVDAEILEGGWEAWQDAGLALVPQGILPKPANDGATLWVTRLRPKIDRIACPWLIRRFVDPKARFLFVAPAQVEAVAERFGATPFDIEGVFWSHRGELCTFDIMVAEFGLSMEPLQRLATIVRGADTARPDLAPEASGLLAVSLGLSRMYTDDLEQLEAGMLLYDALYRWCRDATDETHNWPSAKTRS